MKSPESKKFPTGTGEEFQKVRKEITLPAVEVANKVLWINPAFEGHLPFRLKEGEPTNLGIFLTSEAHRGRKETRSRIIMPEEGGGRSVLAGPVIFADKEGRIYRDVDVKGIGYFFRESSYYMTGSIKTTNEKRKTARGMLDYSYALTDRKYSEKFLEAGIRTHRVVAFIEIDEIVDAATGMKTSVAEAKARGIIPNDMQPVLAVRAFGTKERIDYLSRGPIPRRVRALEDAKAMAAQELGFEAERFTYSDYLHWFAKNLGENVARMKILGLSHLYLSDHNITLDCRVVDLDSVGPAESGDAQKDYNDAYDAVRSLGLKVFNLKLSGNASLAVECLHAFDASYNNALKTMDEELLKAI